MQRIEIGLAKAIGPPELWMGHAQRGRILWIQPHRLRGVRRQGHSGGAELDVAQFAAHGSGPRLAGRIADRHIDRHIGGIGARQRQIGGDFRILQDHRPSRRERDLLPDAHLAIAHARHPVPADRGDKRGTVLTQRAVRSAAVGAALVGHRLFPRIAGMRRRSDQHRQRGLLPGRHQRRHIEDPADERAFDGADLAAVHPYVGGVIDAFKVQPDLLTRVIRRYQELGSIPVRGAAEALGNDVGTVVLAVSRVGVDVVVDQGCEHGTGDGGAVPVGRRRRGRLHPLRRMTGPVLVDIDRPGRDPFHAWGIVIAHRIGYRFGGSWISRGGGRRHVGLDGVNVRRESDFRNGLARLRHVGHVLHQPSRGNRHRALIFRRRNAGQSQAPYP